MVVKLTKNYQTILTALKEKIRQARMRAALTVNTQLLFLYWEIGNTIAQEEQSEGWGAKVVETLANDLKAEFPDMKGLSLRNLRYMRDFATAYPQFSILQAPLAKLTDGKKTQILPAEITPEPILQAPLAQLSWYHHITLLDKIKDSEIRLFYIKKTIENGWSRNVMVHEIENELHKRQGNAITNFENTLPKLQSDLAKETIKSEYLFDFLAMGEEMKERELENALIGHIKKFTLELGRGFAYVGNQYNLLVDDNDYFLDLLFYNYHLHCFVLFELKIGEFKPEYAGKLNFYINTVDGQVKGKDDKPTIGVLLCKTPNKTVIKYSLKGINSPMGVAEYKLLPENVKSEIPTVKELERELEKETEKFQKPVDKKFEHLKELLGTLKGTEAKEKRNPENTEKIFTKAALPLKKQLQNSLKAISEMFLETEIMIWTDNHGHKTDKLAKEYLKKNKHCNEFRIGIRLEGFKRAGTKAFMIWKDIHITLHQYKYTIGFGRSEKDALLEKSFHLLPTKKEIDTIIDKYLEAVIEDITQQVERIK